MKPRTQLYLRLESLPLTRKSPTDGIISLEVTKEGVGSSIIGPAGPVHPTDPRARQ